MHKGGDLAEDRVPSWHLCAPGEKNAQVEVLLALPSRHLFTWRRQLFCQVGLFVHRLGSRPPACGLLVEARLTQAEKNRTLAAYSKL